MTEKQRRKKIAKLAVKLYLAEIAGGGYPVSEGCLKEAEKIVNQNDRYINEISEPEPSTEQIEPPKERKLIGWVMQNEDDTYSMWILPTFTKEDGGWSVVGTKNFVDITPKQAVALCGRVPKWEDSEPTPVKNK